MTSGAAGRYTAELATSTTAGSRTAAGICWNVRPRQELPATAGGAHPATFEHTAHGYRSTLGSSKKAAGGISDIIHIPGLVNADFEDVKTVMSEPGKAMMGTAVAGGPDRANKAADLAVACPS